MACVSLVAAAGEDDPHGSVKQRALELVVDEVLQGKTDEVEILINEVPLSLEPTMTLRDLDGPVDWPRGWAWLLVVDEQPGAYWRHPTRWVFLNRQATRIILVLNKDSLPRIELERRRVGLEVLLDHVRQPREVPERERPPAPPKRDAADDFVYDNYYAVIVQGDMPSGDSYNEFWLDNVIMYQTLLEYGYAPENIHVLYGYGQDETNFPCPWYQETMVDYPAFKQDARDLFTWMRDGNPAEGIAKVTENDFIYLYTFDHGGSNGGCNATLCFMDGCMSDSEFASYFNQIDYRHRAVAMQQCFSGGFIDNLANDTTVVLTAANCYESAYEGNEYEVCNGHTMHHGEWNYWYMSALRGHKPLPGEQPVNEDTNGDGKVSFWEAFQYALDNDDAPEHPQYSDPGGLGDSLSLQTFTEPSVAYVSHAIDDSGPYGNGDGFAQPGETVTIPVTLVNAGGGTVCGVGATLQGGNPEHVRILGCQADFPDLPHGDPASSLPPHYEISLDPDMPCAEVPMTLNLRAVDYQRQLALPFVVGKPSIGGIDPNCAPMDCAEPEPQAIGNSLRLTRVGEADLELSWGAVTDAADYRVWKASVPDFSDEVFLGKTSGGATSYVETGALLDSRPSCYLVRALNSCNQEGP
jgi:hypothetical protein